MQRALPIIVVVAFLLALVVAIVPVPRLVRRPDARDPPRPRPHRRPAGRVPGRRHRPAAGDVGHPRADAHDHREPRQRHRRGRAHRRHPGPRPHLRGDARRRGRGRHPQAHRDHRRARVHARAGGAAGRSARVPCPRAWRTSSPSSPASRSPTRPSARTPTTREIVVDMELKDTGARLFDEYAAEHYGEQFAIVLDDIVMSAPSSRPALRRPGPDQRLLHAGRGATSSPS